MFLVSNKHVVLDAVQGRLFFTLANGDQPRIGEKITMGFDDFGRRWYGHANPAVDIAVMPVASVINECQVAGKPVFVRAIPSSLIPDAAVIQELDAVEQVMFIGYPSGMYDTVNLTPIVRVGVTATPISLDYCGQKAFLIDASVFPGSSGSPVLILNTGSYAPKSGGLTVGGRALFLGVLSAVFTRRDKGEIEIEDIPTVKKSVPYIDQMIDLGYVFKAELIQETVRQYLASQGITM
jgi:hypothetical protein